MAGMGFILIIGIFLFFAYEYTRNKHSALGTPTPTGKNVPPPTPASTPLKNSVTIPFAPDTACPSIPVTNTIGKPAFTFAINNVRFVAEFDSGAGVASLTPATAAAVRLNSFPKGPTSTISSGQQTAGTVEQGFNAPITLGSLPPITTTFYSSPNTSCNLVPARLYTSRYTVALSANQATFT